MKEIIILDVLKAMKKIKQLVIKGIKPYYIFKETGNRFKKIAINLGLKDRDFYYARYIKLPNDSVIIYG